MKFSNIITILGLAAGMASAADFLPLANGNTWTYRDAKTGSTMEVKVGIPTFVNNQTYYSLRGFTPQPLLVRMNEFGNIVYWDQDLEMDLILTGFEVGTFSFEAYGRQCKAVGKTQEKRVDYDGPTGPWNVVEVDYQPYSCADAGELQELYAENIGMVRRVVNTFAGPRTFDLVYARVGRQEITAGKAGRFSITAIPGDGVWNVTLRLEETSGVPAHLRFPSGQEYELRLRDSDGNVLWTWSANRLFIAAFHEINTSRWSATETVPFPPAIPEGGQVYTLEAWLTTAAGDPQFAAAATLDIPATTLVALPTSRDRRRPTQSGGR